ERAATADFVLGQGSTISGRVLQTDGEPFAEGGVQLQSLEMQGLDTGGPGTQTSENGSFTLDNVAPGRYTVTADWSAVETEDGEPATLTVEEGRDLSDLRLVLADGSWGEEPEADGVITGRVYDSRGNPVEDAAVTASMGAFPAQTVSTTEGGVFTIENLWPGAYTVEAQARGEIAHEEGVPLHADIRLNLSPGARIEGLVLDSEGGLAEGVPVSLVNLDDQAAEDEMTDLLSRFGDVSAADQRRTDSSGFFEFGDLRPGRYRVEARDATRGTGESEPVALSRGQERTGVRIRLERGVRVTGRVQDPSGRPVSGAQVRLVQTTDNMMVQAMESAMLAGMGGASHNATTDRQGQFEIANVPPGAYDLVATHRAYATNRVQGVTVRRGADIHGLRAVMSEGGGVRGRLTDSSGQPQSGGVVLMGPGGYHMLTAGSQGEFSIGGLAPGSYLAVPLDTTAMGGGGASQTFPDMSVVDITDGEEANLDFGPAGDIPVSGRLSNHAGGETVVSVRRPGGPHPTEMSMTQIGTTLDMLRHQAGQAVVQPDGSFHIEGLEPGEYIVDVLRFDEQAAMQNPMNFRMESLYEGSLSVEDSDPIDLDIALP
ncbi:MAG: collagen binding domain-containing protein, partial [Candidatus Hydrogenedentota bacterium]